MAEEIKSAKCVYVIGHSGAGKSTICNAYLGSATFPTGLSSDGKGITKEEQRVIAKNGITIVDTTGDDIMSKDNSIVDVTNLTRKIRKDDKIIIVIVLRIGRIHPDDNDLINDIIKKECQYYLILNKTGRIASAKCDFEKIFKLELLQMPSDFLIIVEDYDMSDRDNTMFSDEDQLKIREFIDKF